ncbi:MAG: hypothetical protein ACJA00_002967 [Myxococcota bacterium]|jgi:hypothetical protein
MSKTHEERDGVVVNANELLQLGQQRLKRHPVQNGERRKLQTPKIPQG